MMRKSIRNGGRHPAAVDGIFLPQAGVDAVDILRRHKAGELRVQGMVNRKDYSTERALTMLVGKRRALLDYLKAKDITRYRDIIKELGLRK